MSRPSASKSQPILGSPAIQDLSLVGKFCLLLELLANALFLEGFSLPLCAHVHKAVYYILSADYFHLKSRIV